MVQPQRASGNAGGERGGGSLTQRNTSSSFLGGILLQPQQNQQQRVVKQQPGGGNNSRNGTIMIRIAVISCFLVILTYVIFYLSIFHTLLHTGTTGSNKNDAKSAKLQQQLIRKNESPNDATNLQFAMKYANDLRIRFQKDNPSKEKKDVEEEEILVLTTKVGTIRIVLRPDLSYESVQYMKQMATTTNACGRCNIYRAEKPGILQGVIASPTISIQSIPRGQCPIGSESISNECPEWDTQCNCHGPIMTKGMVGWAAGATGPDFFIDTYERPAKWWGTQHTVFGIIQDTTSFAVITNIYNTQPTHVVSGLTHINEPLHFTLSLE